jgi:bifunctional DNase/RNase
METGLVELRVRGIALDGPDGAPLVVLEDRARRHRLELPAGPFEASAIIMELEGIAPPRPLTHDLLAEVFRDGGLFLDEVILAPAGATGGGTRARLDYHKGLRHLEREVRPADAIALALRLGAPIEAEPELLEALPFRREPEPEERRKPRILLMEDWKERAVGA